MLVGHFAVAFGARRLDRTLSLGTLALAAMFSDFLWALFMLAGVEQVGIRSGVRGAANYLVMTQVAWSHSLLMAAVWGVVFAAVYFALWGNKRGSALLLLVVISHWLLDFVSNPHALPLSPWRPDRVGLGLWASIPATIIVEGGAWLAAVVLYVRGTRAKGPTGVVALLAGSVLLTAIWFDNIAGPAHAPRPQPIGALIVFSLFVGWMFWINRLRPVRS
jgi:hypothetical protein